VAERECRDFVHRPEQDRTLGGSAGGHLTAEVVFCWHSRHFGGGSGLEVPFLDFTSSIPLDLPAGNKLFDMMLSYPSQMPLDSVVISPATKITDETLKKLAMAVVIVCGRDPLHLAGEAYAQRLAQHGKLLD
jgi:acetyl esterase/lipase